MQEITKKLHLQALDEFKPFAEKLAMEGKTSGEIASAFQKQLMLKVEQFYQGERNPKQIGDILRNVNLKDAGSKAEKNFYQMLINSGLRFEFQYSIGPYRADYLFDGFLVVELDGPAHNKEHDEKRDEYMRRMGYKVIRVPVWILVLSPEIVIDGIKEQL